MNDQRRRVFEICEAMHAVAPSEQPTTTEEIESLRAQEILGVTAWELTLELTRWRAQHEIRCFYDDTLDNLVLAVLRERGE